MRRLWPGLPLILVLVSLALFGVAAPSWAHTGSAAQVSDVSVADTTRVVSDQAPTPFLSVAPPRQPGIPWPVLLGGLALAALGWRRPRRVLVFAVVLLLALFAFEDGLHSVHHLVDRSPLNKCAAPGAAAHPNAP